MLYQPALEPNDDYFIRVPTSAVLNFTFSLTASIPGQPDYEVSPLVIVIGCGTELIQTRFDNPNVNFIKKQSIYGEKMIEFVIERSLMVP